MPSTLRTITLALAMAVAAVAAGCIGATETVDPPSPSIPSTTVDPGNTTINETVPDPNVPLGVHPFTGKTAGAGAADFCFNSADGSASSEAIEVKHPNASARVEVAYKAAGTGVGRSGNTIQVSVVSDDFAPLGTKAGPSPIVIDIEGAKIGTSPRILIYTYVCEGVATDQPWTGAVSFWSDAIPANFTALES